MEYEERKQVMEHLYYGIDMPLRYKGKVYFVEGNHDDNHSRLWVDIYSSAEDDHPEVIRFSGKTQEDTRSEFLETPIFDGKTLNQVFSEVEWDDEFY